MNRKASYFVFVVSLAFCIFSPRAFSEAEPAPNLDALCQGEAFPLQKIEWNNALPISLFGKAWGGANWEQPPIAKTGALCNCPSYLLQGATVPGFNILYWSPHHFYDISTIPSCSPLLGGQVLFDGNVTKLGTDGGSKEETVRRNIIDWKVDLFGVMTFLEGMLCGDFSGFLGLYYDSTIDPRMSGLPNGATGENEAIMFYTTLVSFVPAVAEAFTTMIWHPIDLVPFTAGAQSSPYPYRVDNENRAGSTEINFDAAIKHIYRQSATFIEWASVGPTAECFSHPSYFPIKSSYRFNRVWPMADSGGRHLTMGTPLAIWDVTTRNLPTQEDGLYLIWKAKQCCIEWIP
tara:strand:+ start:54648 stop:55688 length:1041 start_codon:yes stop_codon:yes gene_type:complete